MTFACKAIEFVRYQPAGSSPRQPTRDLLSNVDRAAARCEPFMAASTLGYLLHPPFDADVVHHEESHFIVTTDDPFRELVWREVARELHGSATPWWCSKIPLVLQIDVGFIMLTRPGTKTLVTGPLNRPGEFYWTHSGLVETDIFHVPFTINLQLHRPGQRFKLRRDQPIAQVISVDSGASQVSGLLVTDLHSRLELRAEWIAYRDFAFDMSSGVAGTEIRRTRSAYQKWIHKPLKGS